MACPTSPEGSFHRYRLPGAGGEMITSRMGSASEARSRCLTSGHPCRHTSDQTRCCHRSGIFTFRTMEAVRIDVPPSAFRAGFRNEPVGTHTTRTIMLIELRELLGAARLGSEYSCHQRAALELNAVHKAARATRVKTFRRLRELYALSPHVLLFRALVELGGQDVAGQPLIAALCAVARDPLMRTASQRILEAQDGEPVRSVDLEQAVELALPGRFRGEGAEESCSFVVLLELAHAPTRPSPRRRYGHPLRTVRSRSRSTRRHLARLPTRRRTSGAVLCRPCEERRT